MLRSHILPAWADREFATIRRSDVTALMDKIENAHGARAADYVLNVFSSVANWHARAGRRLRAADHQRHAASDH